MLRLQADVKFDTGDKEESAELPGLPAARRAAHRVLALASSRLHTKHEARRPEKGKGVDLRGGPIDTTTTTESGEEGGRREGQEVRAATADGASGANALLLFLATFSRNQGRRSFHQLRIWAPGKEERRGAFIVRKRRESIMRALFIYKHSRATREGS